jgi:hypothetical protein
MYYNEWKCQCVMNYECINEIIILYNVIMKW